MAATSPLLWSPAFALLLGLEAELALVVVLACMSVVPLTMPALALSLLGLEIAISPWMLTARLAAFVGAGFLVAGLLRWWLGPQRLKSNARLLDLLNVIMLVVFAIGVMNGVTERLLTNPAQVLLFAAAAFATNIVLQAVGAAVFAPAGRNTALTVGLMFGYRNMALPLAVLAGAAPPDFALYVAMAQMPMYMLPVLTIPIYRRLLAT
jgi:BASS family bile acid:Na+ symporter